MHVTCTKLTIAKGRPVKGNFKMLIRDKATRALEAVSSLPVKM